MLQEQDDLSTKVLLLKHGIPSPRIPKQAIETDHSRLTELFLIPVLTISWTSPRVFLALAPSISPLP